MVFTRKIFILSLLVFVSGSIVFAGQKMDSVNNGANETILENDANAIMGATGTAENEVAPEETKDANAGFSDIPFSVDVAPPARFIFPTDNQELQGTTEIKIEVSGATEINFYLLRKGFLTPIYLGKGKLSQNNEWSYAWETPDSPNGNYQLFVEVTNQYGTYQSRKIEVVVNNQIKESSESRQRKEELEKIDNQIQEKESNIKEKVNQIKKEIIEETSASIEEAKKEVEGNEEQIEKEVSQERERAKEAVGAKIEEIAKTIQEESQLGKEIEKKIQAKKSLEEKIKVKKEELKKFEKIEPMDVIKEKVEQIKKEKKDIIGKSQEQKEEIEKDIKSKQEKLLKLRAQKELIKQKLLEESLRPVEIIKDKVARPDKILELKREVSARIEKRISNLIQEIAKEGISKAKLEEEMLKDSDSDGLPDSLEIEIGTDSFNPDSDGDGYLDGEEVALKSNPLTPSVASKVIYQDPRKVEPKREDVFIVERAEIRTSEITKKSVLRIEGRALPNVFVTLYIYSLPTVVVTKTDAYGRWVYELDKPLSPGEHEIYVVLTNNKGEITARSEGFNFIKSGANILQLIPEVWAKESGKGMEEVASPYDILRRSFIVLTLAIIILAIGIALLTIGFISRKKEKTYFSSSKEENGSKK